MLRGKQPVEVVMRAANYLTANEPFEALELQTMSALAIRFKINSNLYHSGERSAMSESLSTYA
jgi:hypothetical protein